MNRNKRVQIEKPNRVADGSGGFKTPTGQDAWLPFANVWAKVKVLNSRERFFAEQIQQTESHEWNVRYLRGLTTDMRIKWGIRVFPIVAVRNPSESNRELDIVTEELTAKTQKQSP